MVAAPLEGILVVAVEQAVAAPYCSSRLADAGARVIKVERAEGDFARGYDTAAGEVSSYFAWINRGKESLVADIKDEGDAALLHDIIDRADVFIQNLAPGSAERAGFGAEALRARNPRLITVDISGYGEGHTYSDMKAYDLLIQAESGLAELTGRPEGPGRVGVSVSDISCGMNAHSAVLQALIARARTGEGSAIAVSLFDSIADWMNVPMLYREGGCGEPRRVGLAHPSLAPYGAFETRDSGRLLISIQSEREWAAFCTHFLARPELATAEGFASSSARVANRAAVDGVVAETFAALTISEAEDRLRRAGTAFGRVNTLDGLARHPALRRLPVEVPGGSVEMIAPAPIHDGAPPELRAVPRLGEHGAAIRAEFGKAPQHKKGHSA